MARLQPYHEECQVYPGVFMASPEEEKMLNDLHLPGKTMAEKALVNLDELKDCYRIEAALPGVKRENIFVQVQENMVSIIVLQKRNSDVNKKLQIHEFDCHCLERHIHLPDNADAAFVSAEFRQGILSLYIPKTPEHPAVQSHQIVVY